VSNTSIWLALRNPVFRKLRLATLISGTCIAAHNTVAFSVLGTMDDSAFLISQMSTLSALPFALFTLPAGALADMIDRKRNPYVILASAFLFNLGFAFGSPASSSVVAEIASKEELASANTLGGLQIMVITHVVLQKRLSITRRLARKRRDLLVINICSRLTPFCHHSQSIHLANGGLYFRIILPSYGI
jgi:Na+/melibiose symporter-like transporter